MAFVPNHWGHCRVKFTVFFGVAHGSTGSGAAHRLLPTGGSAYGIPLKIS